MEAGATPLPQSPANLRQTSSRLREQTGCLSRKSAACVVALPPSPAQTNPCRRWSIGAISPYPCGVVAAAAATAVVVVPAVTPLASTCPQAAHSRRVVAYTSRAAAGAQGPVPSASIAPSSDPAIPESRLRNACPRAGGGGQTEEAGEAEGCIEEGDVADAGEEVATPLGSAAPAERESCGRVSKNSRAPGDASAPPPQPPPDGGGGGGFAAATASRKGMHFRRRDMARLRKPPNRRSPAADMADAAIAATATPRS